MKKYWRAMLLFSTLLIAVLASSVVFTNKAHAADPTCGSLSTTFDMSGAWDLNYTVNTFVTPYTNHQPLTFTKQSDGTFLATSTAMGSLSAVAFSVNRAPTTSGDICLLTSIAITQDHPSTSYHAIWSGYEFYDISGAHPLDTGKIVGVWSDLALDRGLFELDKHV